MYLNGLSVIKENFFIYILKFIILCLYCYSKVYVSILVLKLIVDIFFYDIMLEICLFEEYYLNL